jgi:hypothetical protein
MRSSPTNSLWEEASNPTGGAGWGLDRRPCACYQQKIKGTLERRVKFQVSMSLTDVQRAALQTLSASRRGYSLTTAVARGFAFEMLQDLVRVGLATVRRDALGTAKARTTHLRITATGRKAIAE